MARTDLKIQIDAESAKAEAAFDRVSRSTMRMEDQLRKADLAAAQLDQQLEDEAGRAARQRADDMEKLGRGLTAFGLATVAGLGMAVKAAIDWESAWAGVRKTVDGTPEQLSALEVELRELATTLPASHQEIAAVAEAAGQLGVATPDVARFTETMIHLGETTNLTADEAATSIAQLMNVMQTAPEDVDNLGSALVDLGNNGASTERDIIQMAQRIAGAGATVGMTEADVLGFANALASLGIRAEAGGSAISRVMVDMSSSVAEGGEKLNVFAQTAGMSASQFATAFEEDPARAIASFVAGLGRIDQSGGNVFATLEELGFSEVRVRDALLRMANGGDVLVDSLDRGTQAWNENSALIKEAEQRYDTTEAKIQIAKNTLVDLAVDIGGVIMPAVAGLAEGVAGVARWFGDLPGPVKAVGTVLAGLAGAASLAAGGFLLMAPRIREAQDVMRRLSLSAPATAGALTRVGSALGKIGLAGAVVATSIPILNEAAEAIENIGRSGDASVTGVGEGLKALQDYTDGGSKHIDGLVDHVHDLNNGWDQNALRMVGLKDSLGGAEPDLRNVSDALAEMAANGESAAAERIWEDLREQLIGAGANADDVDRAFASATDQFARTAAEAPEAADGIEEAAAAMESQAAAAGMTAEEFQAAEQAAEQMRESLVEQAGSFVSLTEAYDTALADKEERERETAQATADATEDQTDSWEDYIGDVELTVDEYLEQLDRMVENQQNWRENLVSLAGRVPDEMLQHFQELGPAGAETLALFAEMSNEELQRAIPMYEQSSMEGGEAIVSGLEGVGPLLREVARVHGQDAADNLRDSLNAGETTVAQAAEHLGLTLEENLPGEYEVAVDINSERFKTAQAGLVDDMARINAVEVEPTANLNKAALDENVGKSHKSLDGVDVRRLSPFASLDNNPLLDRVRDSHGALDGVHLRTPRPTAGMDISPLEERSSSAHGQLDRVNERRPVPISNLDNNPLDRNAGKAHGTLDGVDRHHPKPISRLINDLLQVDKSEAQAIINALKGKNVTSTMDLDTSVADRQFSKWKEDAKVTIKASFQGTLDNLFGGGGSGGGGGFGGQAQGGWRNPMSRGTYRVGGGINSYPGHTGQDLPAPTGTGVFAARAGRVSRAMTMSGSYGNHVYIDHAGGYQTRYAHLSRRNVSAGQVVPSGRRIGSVGSTGNSTGPHLHFEIRRGGSVIAPRSRIRFAKGGVIEGPGTGTSDDVPILASNGEYVTKAAAVNHYGKEFMHKINNMELPKIPHMASGGSVGNAPSSSGGGGCTHLNISTPMSEVVATVRRELKYDQKARQLSGRF